MRKINLRQQTQRDKNNSSLIDSYFDTEIILRPDDLIRDIVTERQLKNSENEKQKIVLAAGDEAIDQDNELAELSQEESSEDISGDDFNAFNDTNLQHLKMNCLSDRILVYTKPVPKVETPKIRAGVGLRSQISFARDSASSS